MKNITLVLGTAREGRASEAIAKVLEAQLQARGVTVTFIDVRDHLQSFATVTPWLEENDASATYRAAVASCDALVFVVPEYNRGYPGEWKLLVDSIKEEYADKPTFLVGTSSGVFAGTRVVEQVILVLSQLQCRIMPAKLHVPKVGEAVLADGDGFTPSEAFAPHLERFVEAVIVK